MGSGGGEGIMQQPGEAGAGGQRRRKQELGRMTSLQDTSEGRGAEGQGDGARSGGLGGLRGQTRGGPWPPELRAPKLGSGTPEGGEPRAPRGARGRT